ncbi:MAG: hypothetical protein M1820_000526 [Bogoriella megaspora]|nr:MAG: hypothetical protein M1820_000526 [Bogoriella megaspora]
MPVNISVSQSEATVTNFASASYAEVGNAACIARYDISIQKPEGKGRLEPGTLQRTIEKHGLDFQQTGDSGYRSSTTKSSEREREPLEHQTFGDFEGSLSPAPEGKSFQETIDTPVNELSEELHASVIESILEPNRLLVENLLGVFTADPSGVFSVRVEKVVQNDLMFFMERNYTIFRSLQEDSKAQGMSFFVQDNRRDDIVRTHLLTEQLLADAARILLSSASGQQEELDYDLTDLVALHSDQGFLLDSILEAFDPLQRFWIFGLILALILSSYAGYHCQDTMPGSRVAAAEEFRIVVHGRTRISFTKGRLACLDGFIGGPIWMFARPNAKPIGLTLSITASEFADLWGPLWGIENKERTGIYALFTERGEIVEGQSSSRKAKKPLPIEGGIVCHWSSLNHSKHMLHRERTLEFSGGRPFILPSSTNRRLLIGAPLEPGLHHNFNCLEKIDRLVQNRSFQTRVAGAHGSNWEIQSRTATLSGGHFINIGGTQTYRAVPASSQKDRIFAFLQKARAFSSVMSVLNWRVGLEISLCTGNAERVSLWEALRLSCADIINTRAPNNQKEPLIHGAVLTALSNLEFTGPVSNGFHACWPFSGAPGLYTIPISKDESPWIDMIANTEYTSCLAVMSARYLEFYYGDAKGVLARTCPGRNRDMDANSGQPSDDAVLILSIENTWHDEPVIPLSSPGPKDVITKDDPTQNVPQTLRTISSQAENCRHKNIPQLRTTLFKTSIQLDPSTPIEHIRRRDEHGNIRLWKHNRIYIRDLGTLEIIRDRGVQLASRRTEVVERLRRVVEKPLAHRELVDPQNHSGLLIEICVV